MDTLLKILLDISVPHLDPFHNVRSLQLPLDAEFNPIDHLFFLGHQLPCDQLPVQQVQYEQAIRLQSQGAGGHGLSIIGPIIQGTFAKAYDAGVPIVFGTDTGVSAHGDNAQEFALMVEGGMPPMEAIKAATSVAARFLDIDDAHGTVEPGKQADIIAVPGNPLEDIRVLENVHFVMKAGQVYKKP